MKRVWSILNGFAAIIGWSMIALLLVALITGKEPVIYLADPAWDEEDWEKLLEEIEEEGSSEKESEEEGEEEEGNQE